MTLIAVVFSIWGFFATDISEASSRHKFSGTSRHFCSSKRQECQKKQSLPSSQASPEPTQMRPTIVPRKGNNNQTSISSGSARDIFVAFGLNLVIDRGVQTQDSEAILSILAEEIRAYDPGFLKEAGVRAIRIAKNLSVDDRVLTIRRAVPDVATDTLAIDSKVIATTDSSHRISLESSLRHIFHHELFHMIDYAYFEKIKGETTWATPNQDPDWASLNVRGFSYARGGEHMQNDVESRSMQATPGFINGYSTASMLEDKAEIFSHKMTNSYVIRRKMSDPIIQAKVTRLRVMMDTICQKKSRKNRVPWWRSDEEETNSNPKCMIPSAFIVF